MNAGIERAERAKGAESGEKIPNTTALELEPLPAVVSPVSLLQVWHVLLRIMMVTSTIFGAVLLLSAFSSAASAPQQAALAAEAVGVVVIPYCFARAFDMFKT